MRRLVFEGGSVPEELNEVFEGQKPIRIEMRDGSVILLSSTLLVEMDAEGNQTKAVEMDRFRFEAGETQGQKITLDGFSGRAKTESGKEGDFWISQSLRVVEAVGEKNHPVLTELLCLKDFVVVRRVATKRIPISPEIWEELSRLKEPLDASEFIPMVERLGLLYKMERKKERIKKSIYRKTL
jgi:hypothetical protein